MNDDEFLKHYGVLGMHWGHKQGGASATIPKHNSEDHNKKVLLKGKKLNELTNAELKVINERMQLERQYKELSKTDISKGKKFVTDLLGNTAKEVANQYAKKYATKILDDLVKKAAKTAKG